mgnify:CR=1 FL=1
MSVCTSGCTEVSMHRAQVETVQSEAGIEPRALLERFVPEFRSARTKPDVYPIGITDFVEGTELRGVGEPVGNLTAEALADEVGLSPSALSQHLAKLRGERLVAFRRDSQTIWYRIADPKVEELFSTLHRLFCGPKRR